MSGKFVLDACSVIAYFRDEDGAATVERLFDEASEGSTFLIMHKLNLYEVYYDFAREADKEKLSDKIEALKSLPIRFIETISDSLIEEAANFKLSNKMSVADSFALATAKIEGAKLVTSDHHEFDPIDKSGDMEFLWIR
jgi:predicted nucleic acid-binding protein